MPQRLSETELARYRSTIYGVAAHVGHVPKMSFGRSQHMLHRNGFWQLLFGFNASAGVCERHSASACCMFVSYITLCVTENSTLLTQSAAFSSKSYVICPAVHVMAWHGIQFHCVLAPAHHIPCMSLGTIALYMTRHWMQCCCASTSTSTSTRLALLQFITCPAAVLQLQYLFGSPQTSLCRYFAAGSQTFEILCSLHIWTHVAICTAGRNKWHAAAAFSDVASTAAPLSPEAVETAQRAYSAGGLPSCCSYLTLLFTR